MNDKHYIGERAASFAGTGTSAPADGVRLIVDEATAYLAGDQSGNVMEVECPYGTQEMAEAILAAVKGRSCVGYEAEGAALPPTAELGDGVTVKGIYAPLASRTVSFGPGHLSGIGAPGESQVSHEFGYTDPVQRAIDRKAAQTRSYIDKQTDAIRIGVEEMEKGVSAELGLKIGRGENDQIVSMLNASADVINIRGNRLTIDSDNFKVAADGTVTCTGGKVGGWTIGEDSLSGANEWGSAALSPYGLIQDYGTGRLTIIGGDIQARAVNAEYYNDLIRLLWTNPRPASAFPAQTLLIPELSMYNLFVVVQNYGVSSPAYTSSGVYIRGTGTSLAVNCGTYAVGYGGNGHVSSQRVYGFGDMQNGRMTVSGGRVLNNSGMTEDDDFGIPLAVIGMSTSIFF